MSNAKGIIGQSREYFKVLVEKMAGVFATPNSEIIVHEPKQGTIKGYAEERYGASVTNPNLDLLPDGYRDALTRLDTRFKIDKILEFAAEKCPEIEPCLHKIVDVRWLEEQTRLGQMLEDGYKAGSSKVSEERLRSHSHNFNRSLEQTWRQVETFLDGISARQKKYLNTFEFAGKSYRMPEESVSKESLMEYIESMRPYRKDSYDLYVQSLYSPEKKNNQFGIILCDGISSQYMTQAEAMQMNREGKNAFLDTAPKNSVWKQPDLASRCNMASSIFGPAPENMEQLNTSVEQVIKEAAWYEVAINAVKSLARSIANSFTPHEPQPGNNKEEHTGPTPGF